MCVCLQPYLHAPASTPLNLRALQHHQNLNQARAKAAPAPAPAAARLIGVVQLLQSVCSWMAPPAFLVAAAVSLFRFTMREPGGGARGSGGWCGASNMTKSACGWHLLEHSLDVSVAFSEEVPFAVRRVRV